MNMEILGANEVLDVKQDKIDSMFNILILKESSAFLIRNEKGELGLLLNQDFVNLWVGN